MSTATIKDGTHISYNDWCNGRPGVFSHGWPLTAGASDAQMLFLGEPGYRVIAPDRRGHGRSDQPRRGNDMNTYAADFATLIETLDLHDTTLVGHSTGGSEVAHYLDRHGTARRSGSADRRRTAADAADRGQPRRHPAGRLRRHPRRGRGQPLAVLSRPGRAPLQRQPARGQRCHRA
jgi:pimeloyl-ACP methyl ester carboxylesterase